ncbi:hypothetical protein BHE74_00027344 [Ensete ventricosum]|nr:hypothetical protein GW17_00042708 [Ensete ventricosum]RWW65352.1 hypothetical protein BHE74_00027344 [Ensete ventricosum]
MRTGSRSKSKATAIFSEPLLLASPPKLPSAREENRQGRRRAIAEKRSISPPSCSWFDSAARVSEPLFKTREEETEALAPSPN